MRIDSTYRFVIEPENLFSNLKAKIEHQTFEIEDLSNAIKILRTLRGHESEDDFIHLFDDMDLNSSRLGNTNAARTKLVGKVMMNISTLPFVHSDLEIDMLGDAYEYLIGQFAASAGKKLVNSIHLNKYQRYLRRSLQMVKKI